MKSGTTVRFTGGPFGTVAHLDSSKFEEEVVNEGDTGTYFGPHPNPHLKDTWHVIAVTLGGRELFVPLHESQFEEAA